MRAAAILPVLVLLAACAGDAVVKPVPSGSNRADGIVTMSSQASIYQPVQPDWSGAHDRAARQCRGWGHRSPPVLAGSKEECLFWDSWGRCAQSTTTRFYSCAG